MCMQLIAAKVSFFLGWYVAISRGIFGFLCPFFGHMEAMSVALCVAVCLGVILQEFTVYPQGGGGLGTSSATAYTPKFMLINTNTSV